MGFSLPSDPAEKDPVKVNVMRVADVGREGDTAHWDLSQWVLLTTGPAVELKSDGCRRGNEWRYF